MERLLWALLTEPALAHSLAHLGRETVLARHTCDHRVRELLGILRELGVREEAVA
jgi:spore maturation protein CgeB